MAKHPNSTDQPSEEETLEETQARLKAGWVTEAELAPPAAEPAAEAQPQA